MTWREPDIFCSSTNVQEIPAAVPAMWKVMVHLNSESIGSISKGRAHIKIERWFSSTHQLVSYASQEFALLSSGLQVTIEDTHNKGVSMENKASKPSSAEMFPGPGFRVNTEFHRLDPDFMVQFAEFDTPDISDLLNRMYAVDPAITRLTSSHHRLCGPACTVKVFPGDNLMVHKSLDVAIPGDIVVIDAHGSSMNAVLGDLVSTKAKHRGIAGFVVDGFVRDLPNILELDFPIFARGTTSIGPLHRGPGEINYPICCGGIVVNPGDILVADGAGIVVIPQEIASDLLVRLRSQKATQAAYLAGVKRGNFSNDWVDKILMQAGCMVTSPPEKIAV